MLIIAAILALFATQSPTTPEPAATAESVAIEAPVKQEAKPKITIVPALVESGNQ
jgi:hypothetical protein